MAGLVRRIAQQISPRSSWAKDPEDAVEHIAGISPRAAFAIVAAGRIGNQWRQQHLLLVSQAHDLL
jgi:hypothetical protein